MKKVKAVSAHAANNDVQEGQINPVQPKVKRRVRTSAAMIGIAISMGTSNLLITRPSDRTPAAEPTGHEPMVSTTAPEVAQGERKDLIAPSAVKSLPISLFVPTLSTGLLPTPQVQLKTAASATFTLTEENETAQKRQTLQQPSRSSQVNAVTSNKLDDDAQASANSLQNLSLTKEKVAPLKVSRPDIQAEQALEARRVNQLLQKLRNSQKVKTIPQAYRVNGSKTSSSAVTAASQSLQAKESVSNISARQRALINSLKQKPNHLRDRLITWKAQQSDTSIASTTKSAKQINNQTINVPFVLGTVQVQQLTERSPQAPIDNGRALSLQQPQLTKSGVFVIPDISQSAVNKPNLVSGSISQNYQVKAGDTLIAIAKQHKIPLSELVKANKLTNPNRLQVSQELKVPASENRNASVAQAPNLGVWQANANGAIANNPETNLQQSNLAVSPQSLTENQYQQESFAGMGGNISDDDTVVPTSPATVAQTQQFQSTAAKSQLQSNLYVQELRSDIERLRQKYSAQNTARQFVPPANTTANATATVATLQLPVLGTAANFAGAINSSQLRSNQPINPEFRAAQVPENSKPEAKQPPLSKANTDAQPKPRSSLATAPLGLNASESLNSLRGQQVSPDLPPLGTAGTYLPQPGTATFKGFIWPSKGALTSGYGWRWGRMHKGIDIAAPVGTPIVAAAPGVVVKAGWNSGGYGNLVDIQHADGTLTRYAHNKKILVHTGQQVEQGQQISEMGSTGFSTGPHLHFEVHPLGKKAVNPIAYLPGK